MSTQTHRNSHSNTYSIKLSTFSSLSIHHRVMCPIHRSKHTCLHAAILIRRISAHRRTSSAVQQIICGKLSFNDKQNYTYSTRTCTAHENSVSSSCLNLILSNRKPLLIPRVCMCMCICVLLVVVRCAFDIKFHLNSFI